MRGKEEITLLESKLLFEGNKKFLLRLYGPDNYKSALISHYAYSKDRKLKKDAITYTKELLDGYFEYDITNAVAEDCIRDLFGFEQIPFPKPSKPKFKFIDLFAGIGGFRIAMQRAGGECVFSSEWDKAAQQTYLQNYGELPFGDITKSEVKKWIPDKFDVLCAGFPCQPFSNAGLRKGFEDTRGTLFFHIAEIVSQKKEKGTPPKVLLLENVKGFKNHDKGNTLKTILRILHELEYEVDYRVLSSKNFGVPQNRERIYIVAWQRSLRRKFKFPLGIDTKDNVIYDAEELVNAKPTCLGDILELNPDPKYTISDNMYRGHINRKKKHEEKGNGFGFSMFKHSAPYANTISARYWKDGSEILIDQGSKNPRRLTTREAAKLQGFPDEFILNKSEKETYKQFGNSVTVDVVTVLADEIQKQLL